MDARLFVDVDCSRAGRPCWTWHQNRNSPCASVSEDGRGFVLVALQHQISLVPVRSCCSIRRLFWRFVFGKLANWPRLYPNSNLDRTVADVYRRALLVRCCVRRNSRNSLCAFSGAFSFATNRKSAIENRKLDAEGVRFELTRPFGLPVFKTGAINRSATPPATKMCAGYFAIRAPASKGGSDHTFSSRSNPSREVSRAARHRSCKDRQDIAFRCWSSCAHKASNRFRRCLDSSAARHRENCRPNRALDVRYGESVQTLSHGPAHEENIGIPALFVLRKNRGPHKRICAVGRAQLAGRDFFPPAPPLGNRDSPGRDLAACSSGRKRDPLDSATGSEA